MATRSRVVDPRRTVPPAPDIPAPVNGAYVVVVASAVLTSERVFAAPAAGLAIVDTGAGGTVGYILANDLAALEGLAGTGIAIHTGVDTWTERSVVATTPSIVITNGNGVAGNIGVDTAQDIRATASPTFVDLTLSGVLRILATTIAFANSPYAVLATDGAIRGNTVAGNINVLLPAASGSGRWIPFHKTTADANTLTATANGGDLINGVATAVLANPHSSFWLHDAAAGIWDLY